MRLPHPITTLCIGGSLNGATIQGRDTWHGIAGCSYLLHLFRFGEEVYYVYVEYHTPIELAERILLEQVYRYKRVVK